MLKQGLPRYGQVLRGLKGRRINTGMVGCLLLPCMLAWMSGGISRTEPYHQT